MNTYAATYHKNSNNSRRRRLCGWTMNKKTGQPEFKDHVTTTITKSEDGFALPHIPTLIRRNKYVPHIGFKQLGKEFAKQSKQP